MIVVDKDECAPGMINRCSPEADCVNKEGGYECKCHAGFINNGEGFTCQGMRMFH